MGEKSKLPTREGLPESSRKLQLQQLQQLWPKKHQSTKLLFYLQAFWIEEEVFYKNLQSNESIRLLRLV